jgi:hypothetical protein
MAGRSRLDQTLREYPLDTMIGFFFQCRLNEREEVLSTANAILQIIVQLRCVVVESGPCRNLPILRHDSVHPKQKSKSRSTESSSICRLNVLPGELRSL